MRGGSYQILLDLCGIIERFRHFLRVDTGSPKTVHPSHPRHPQTRVLLFQFSIPPTSSLISLSYVQSSCILLDVQILFEKNLISVNNSFCQPLDRGRSVIVAIVIVQMHQRLYHFEGILSQNFSMYALVCNLQFVFYLSAMRLAILLSI